MLSRLITTFRFFSFTTIFVVVTGPVSIAVPQDGQRGQEAADAAVEGLLELPTARVEGQKLYELPSPSGAKISPDAASGVDVLDAG